MTTRTVLDSELQSIRDDLLRMSSLVDQAIDRAVKAVVERDATLAQQIIDEDKVLNEMRYKVENDTVHAIATQQPMAGDLRALVASLTIAINLERMGDHAEGISKMLVTDDVDAMGELVIDLPRMAETCREMLREAMDAFLERDAKKARKVAEKDHDLDSMYKQMFSDLIDKMLNQEMQVSRGTYQLWAAHNLERVGDRVTNICERVEFSATGEMLDLNPSQTEE